MKKKSKLMKEKSDSQITMDIAKKIAELDPMIKLTTDVTSNYEDGCLPILILK
jgi:hypothetical protein